MRAFGLGMQCPACALQLPDDARFCGGCGHRFEPLPANPPTAAERGAAQTPARGATEAPRFELVPEDFARALERACAKAGIAVPRGEPPTDHESLFRGAEAAGLTKLDVEKALHLVSLEKLPVSARKAMGVVLEGDVGGAGRPIWLPLVVGINLVALLVGVGAFLLHDAEPERPAIQMPAQKGEIDVDALHQALDQLSQDAQACYREALKEDPKLAGALTLTLRIGLDGQAEEARAARDELGHQGAARCILEAARRARYPAARIAPVEVDVPLTFAAK